MLNFFWARNVLVICLDLEMAISLVEEITQLKIQPIVSLPILVTFHGESLKHSLLKENCFKFDKPNLGLS